jgi:hypothetical protein
MPPIPSSPLHRLIRIPLHHPQCLPRRRPMCALQERHIASLRLIALQLQILLPTQRAHNRPASQNTSGANPAATRPSRPQCSPAAHYVRAAHPRSPPQLDCSNSDSSRAPSGGGGNTAPPPPFRGLAIHGNTVSSDRSRSGRLPDIARSVARGLPPRCSEAHRAQTCRPCHAAAV